MLSVGELVQTLPRWLGNVSAWSTGLIGLVLSWLLRGLAQRRLEGEGPQSCRLTRWHLSNSYYLTCSGELWKSLASALTLPRWDSAALRAVSQQVVLIN